MKKNKSSKILNLSLSFGFILFFISCTSTKPNLENISIVNSKNIEQTPSVISNQLPKPTNIEETYKQNDFKNFYATIKGIEDSFIAQNCTEVLIKAKSLEELAIKINYTELPSLAQVGIFTCDAKAGIDNHERLLKAISVLTTTNLRLPVINKAWLHNTLSDFYLALGDKLNALNEKKSARDLITAQQQDIIALNAQIQQLDPTEINPNSLAPQPDYSNLSSDQIAATATQLINDDAPEQAIALIDSVPNDKVNANLKRIRADAVNTLVRNLRFKVRALFERAAMQTGPTKKETLLQCEQILEGIIRNYPDYSDMNSVKNNLKQVKRELAKP